MSKTTTNDVDETFQVQLNAFKKSYECEIGKTADVFFGIESTVVGPKIKVDSTSLTLTDKIGLEKIAQKIFLAEKLPFQGLHFVKKSQDQSTKLKSSPPPDQKARLTPFGINVAKKAIPGVRKIIAVGSGKGGVGKSTISSNLAAGLAQKGLRVGLLDCDVYGPSAAVMFGISGIMAVNAEGRLEPRMSHGVKVVSFGLLSDAKAPVIWRGPLVSKAIEQLCYDVAWGDLDYLILDLPPGTGDVQLTLIEKIPLHGAIVVSTPQDIALIDAEKAVSMFEKLDVKLLGVVENMSVHVCSQCGHQEHIFGTESFQRFLRERKLGRIVSLPLSLEVRQNADSGTPAVLLEGPAGEILRQMVEQITQSAQFI